MSNILIIDDEKAIRKTLSEILSYEGYKIDEAGDGEEGFTLFQMQPVDLILTDMSMSKMTGLQFIAKIQAHAPQIPIIGMSGGLHPRLVDLERRRLGIQGFFPKPMELHDLRRTIRTVLAQRPSVTTAA